VGLHKVTIVKVMKLFGQSVVEWQILEFH